jgi:hypothetical protein
MFYMRQAPFHQLQNHSKFIYAQRMVAEGFAGENFVKEATQNDPPHRGSVAKKQHGASLSSTFCVKQHLLQLSFAAFI